MAAASDSTGTVVTELAQGHPSGKNLSWGLNLEPLLVATVPHSLPLWKHHSGDWCKALSDLISVLSIVFPWVFVSLIKIKLNYKK